MKTEKLDYNLPSELIAQHPAAKRTDSRLLVLHRRDGDIIDSRFERLGDFLSPGDCLILNNTKVLPARFFARRVAGGQIEGLFLAESSPCVWEVMLKGARKVRPGDILRLRDRSRNDFCRAGLLQKAEQGRCLLKVEAETDVQSVLEKIGFPPLPPYIKRDDDPVLAKEDRLRYQTVYARVNGAVAAPTAGLHFTESLIEQLQQQGIDFAYITLHVGTGTFRPVSAENLEEHQMQSERFAIDSDNARKINAAKDRGGRIIAVGTTSTRTLETLSGPRVEAATGTTNLFITPGYEFKFIDAMITNFHLPKTTLLALVAAFAGLENTLAAYRHAIAQRYRFYSYGDAMMIV